MLNDRLSQLGFIPPQTPSRHFDISHWSENKIPNDHIYSVTEKVDNITLSRGSYLYAEAKYAGSFRLEEGAVLVAPNLEKCNSVLLSRGAKAWLPKLKKTEEGWFAGSDINRNGTVLVEEDALLVTNSKAKFKYRIGNGQIIFE